MPAVAGAGDACGFPEGLAQVVREHVVAHPGAYAQASDGQPGHAQDAVLAGVPGMLWIEVVLWAVRLDGEDGQQVLAENHDVDLGGRIAEELLIFLVQVVPGSVGLDDAGEGDVGQDDASLEEVEAYLEDPALGGRVARGGAAGRSGG